MSSLPPQDLCSCYAPHPCCSPQLFAVSTSPTQLSLTFSAYLHLLLSQTRFRALPQAPEATCASGIREQQGGLGAWGPALPLSHQLSVSDLSTAWPWSSHNSCKRGSSVNGQREVALLRVPCSENQAVWGTHTLGGTQRWTSEDAHSVSVTHEGLVPSGHWLRH